ncbi:MAG: MMPL family transporter [Clostridia bacterium]|nr:MMPL family transporter [Clostridia bacterium]
MKNYIEFIIKNRKKLIALLVILNITALIGIFQIKINADFDIFKMNDSIYQDELNEMDEIFGSSQQTLLMVKADNLDEIIPMVNEILDQFTTYVSPTNLLEMMSQNNIDEVSTISPILKYGEDQYVIYRLDTGSKFDFEGLMDQLDEENLETYFSGDAYMQYEIVHMITGVLLKIPPLALFFILLTFRSQLSSKKAALLSVMPAGLAALWTMGLVGWFGGEVSIITVLAPIFAIVIGSADGLHFITHLEEGFADNLSHKDNLIHTLSIVGMPMIITTTTSVAGFLGLLMIQTSAIQDLAIFASIGVFLAGVVTWYVLPVIFTGNITLKHKESHTSNLWIKSLWGTKSILIAIALIIFAITFIPNLNTEFNQLLFFKENTPVQKNFEKIIEVNGGAVPVYYTGHFNLSDAATNLPEINTILMKLEASNDVARVTNPLSMISFDGKPNLSQMALAKDFIQIKNDQLYYRFMVFPKDLNNDTIAHIEETITNENANGHITGVQFLMRELNENIVKGQILSILTTLVLILIMLLMTLKSFKLTMIAALPIMLTSIILYGFLGLTGISLNLMTCTIFSITLGIGVDYAIHYMSVYKHFNDNHHEAPIEEAFKYTSRPIIANAFGLSLGMTALWLSPLRIHQHISSLMWVSMIVAVYMSLTLLPTILKKVRG